MPNHTANILTVDVPKDKPEMLAEIQEAMRGPDYDEPNTFTEAKYNPVCLQAMVPAPTELKGTRSPPKIVTPEELKAWRKEEAERVEKAKAAGKDPFPMGRPITVTENERFMKEYGCNNWYDWNVSNWGTKWDTYDHHWNPMWQDNTVYFESAWSPPAKALLTFSQRYPDAVFSVDCADEGGGFLTTFVIMDGEIMRETSYAWPVSDEREDEDGDWTRVLDTNRSDPSAVELLEKLGRSFWQEEV